MSSAAAEPLPAGHVIGGRYVVDRPLGQGGMGTVYLCRHVELGRKVAIKVVHPRHATDEEMVERLRREARAAASVGHPTIVEVTDIGSDGGVPFIVMEALEGRSLSDLLAVRVRLDPSAAVFVVSRVLEGLEAVHARGIVHRDLKPENIFVQRAADGSERIKILDFGISKHLAPDEALHLTRTGVVLGTPYYMSPEQARGARDLDLRVDIWAIGIVLYEAVTGRLPYDGQSYNELLGKILSEPFLPPRKILPALPEELEAVILEALARDREQRFASATAFLDALRRVEALLPPARPLLVGPEGEREEPDASTVELTPPLPTTPAATTTSDLPRPRRPRGLAITAVVLALGLGGGAALWLTRSGAAATVGSAVIVTMPNRGGALPVAPAAGAAAAERPEPAPAAPAADRVVLLFEDLPAGASVLLDGRAVGGESATVLRGEDLVEVALLLDGQVVARQLIVPDRSRAVRFTPASVEPTRPGKRPRTGPGAVATPDPTPPVESPGAAEPPTGSADRQAREPRFGKTPFASDYEEGRRPVP